MSESDQEKTEQPSHRKKTKARQKGNVPKSQELRSAIMILIGAMVLKLVGPWMGTMLMTRFVESFGGIASLAVTADSVPVIAVSWATWMGKLLAPLFAVLSVVAIASSAIIQGGFVFTTQPLALNIGRLNPVSGAKNIFSTRMIFNLLRDVIKVLLIGFVCYFVIRDAITLFTANPDIAISDILSGAGMLVTTLLLRTGLVLFVLGLVDLAYQKRKRTKDLKMSKREVKDEAKESEGDPLVKGRQRSEARDLARRRMMTAVPDADVVLTNPTEYAVALKYDPEQMGAPRLVAKGQRLIAQKIKEIARAAGVPIIENKYLARMLFRLAPIGGEIPVELYRAVAEVMSFVYRQKGRIPAGLNGP